MGLKSLFKVRKPGHGSKWEAKAKAANKSAMARKFPSHDNSQNSGPKTPVKRGK